MICISTIDMKHPPAPMGEIAKAVAAFDAILGKWEKTGPRGDKHFKNAWDSNRKGLRTQKDTTGNGHYLVRVYDGTTSITFLLGKIHKQGTVLDLTEVLGNPAGEEDFLNLDDLTKEFLAHREKNAPTLAQYSREARPLGCLFSWASLNATTVTLTANTVGLIKLYGAYGFKPDSFDPQIDRYFQKLARYADYQRYLDGLTLGKSAWNQELSEMIGAEYESKQKPAKLILEEMKKPETAKPWLDKVKDSSNDVKFAQVDQGMTLSTEGAQRLRAAYRILIHWVGSVI